MNLQKKNLYLYNLQILRAFAATIVVVFHAMGTSVDYGLGSNGFEWLGDWGRSGVDIFFVLSGYLMYRLHGHHQTSAPIFIFKRLARIVPTYWLLTLFYILLVVFLPSMFRQASFDASYAISSFLFVSVWLEGSQPYIGPGWTLEYEMVFYALFALAIFVPYLKALRLLVVVSGAVMGLVLLTGFGSVAISFCLGMIAAATPPPADIARKWGVLLVVLVIGVLVYVASIPYNYEVPRWIKYGVPASLIVYALALLPQVKSLIGGALGDASYSIYLIQMFTIPFMAKIWPALGLNFSYGFVPATVIVTSAAGLFIWVAFERPMMRLTNWLLRRPGARDMQKAIQN